MGTPSRHTPDIASLTRDAEAGVASAQFDLGVAWLNGTAGSRDPEQAWHWLERAAAQGDAEAHAVLGIMCLNGQAQGKEGGPDPERALAFLEAALAQDSVEASYSLGTLLISGYGIEPDISRGAALIEAAAHRGHGLALTEAAVCLEHGISLERSPARALRAWQLAAGMDMPRGWFVLGSWLMEGRFVAADPALARACFQRAALADYPLASDMLEILAGEPETDARRALEVTATAPPAMAFEKPSDTMGSAQNVTGTGETTLQSIHGTMPNPTGDKMEMLSHVPRIGLLRDFTPPETRAHLIDRARKLIRPSQVLTGAGMVSRRPIRTSEEMTFYPSMLDVTVWHLERRMHDYVNMPMENGEPLTILHYTGDAEYKPHYDYFDPAKPGYAKGLLNGGQRIITVLSYLNPVAAGGATTFPELNLAINPEPGALLVFHSVDENGAVDPRTLHAGLPVTRGEKWLATRWIRENPFNPA